MASPTCPMLDVLHLDSIHVAVFLTLPVPDQLLPGERILTFT